MKRKSIVKLIFYVTSFIVLIFCILLINAYIQIQKLPVVQEQLGFINNFVPEGEYSLDLERCTDWSDLMFAWCVKSPYFPYRRLKITQIKQEQVKLTYSNGQETNLSTDGRWILTDPFWKIFYIGYAKFPEKLRYFGPYKIIN